jgi:hypothetical protein
MKKENKTKQNDVVITSSYIVCWIEENEMIDYYMVFAEGSTGKNYTEALALYNKLKNKDSTYSANLTKVMETTEWYPNGV